MPLGIPVLPDVNMIKAVSWGVTRGAENSPTVAFASETGIVTTVASVSAIICCFNGDVIIYLALVRSNISRIRALGWAGSKQTQAAPS